MSKPEFDATSMVQKLKDLHKGHPYLRSKRATTILGALICSPFATLWIAHYREQQGKVVGSKTSIDELLPNVYAQLVRESYLLADQMEAANIYIEPASNLLVPELATPDIPDSEGG